MPEALSIMSQFTTSHSVQITSLTNKICKNKQEEEGKKDQAPMFDYYLGFQIHFPEWQQIFFSDKNFFKAWNVSPWPVSVLALRIFIANTWFLKSITSHAWSPAVFPRGTHLVILIETQKINLPYWNGGKEHVCLLPGELIGACTDSVWNTKREDL